MQLGSFAGFDFAWLAKLGSLLVLPFAHEELAIILGGYIVVNNLVPVGLVAVCIYGGMVGSDFALYGIGAGARRVPWLSRWAVDDRVKGFGEAVKRNLFGLVAFCRVAPGVDFIAFIACGWARVPLGRFLIATLIVSALYLPLMLYLVVVFGDALDDHLGVWAWPVLLAAFSVAAFVRHRVFGLRAVVPEVAAGTEHSCGARHFRRRDVRLDVTALPRPQGAGSKVIPRTLRWLRSR
jgi:membrane protein DedA with SNARE-associated domain